MIVKSALNGGLAEVDDELGARLVESGQWLAHGEVVKPARKPRTVKPKPAADDSAE